MPTASCAAVQLSVGLPATAGGAVTTGLTSGAVLSTTAGVDMVSALPVLSVTIAEMVTGPSGGRALTPPAVVFQTRVQGAAPTGAAMLCRTAFAPAQRHWTLRMPAVASAASVASATVVPP